MYAEVAEAQKVIWFQGRYWEMWSLEDVSKTLQEDLHAAGMAMNQHVISLIVLVARRLVEKGMNLEDIASQTRLALRSHRVVLGLTHICDTLRAYGKLIIEEGLSLIREP